MKKHLLLMMLLLCITYQISNAAILPFLPDVLDFRDDSMIAVKPFIEYFDWKVSVNGKSVTLTQGQHTFSFTEKVKSVKVNGEQIELNLAPFNKNGISYVPLEPMVNAMGGTVDFNNKNCVINFPDTKKSMTLNRSRVAENFVTEKGYEELYITNLDGSGFKQITYSTWLMDTLPTMTKDGNFFLFNKENSLYIRAVSSIEENLLATVDENTMVKAPIIDSNGELIIWPITIDNKKNELWILKKSNPKDIKKITGRTPAFSNSGKQIAYSAPDEKGIDTIYIMDYSGENVKPLGKGFAPHFSPDDSFIVWSHIYSGKNESLVTYYLAEPKVGKIYQLKKERQLLESEFFQSFAADCKSIVYGSGQGVTDYSIVQEVFITSPDRNKEPECLNIDKNYIKFPVRNVRYDHIGKYMVYEKEDRLFCKQLFNNKLISLANNISISKYAITPDNKSVLFFGTN